MEINVLHSEGFYIITFPLCYGAELHIDFQNLMIYNYGAKKKLILEGQNHIRKEGFLGGRSQHWAK